VQLAKAPRYRLTDQKSLILIYHDTQAVLMTTIQCRRRNDLDGVHRFLSVRYDRLLLNLVNPPPRSPTIRPSMDSFAASHVWIPGCFEAQYLIGRNAAVR
jgi:hypothetical protein